MGLTIYRETTDVSIEKIFGTAKETVNSGTTFSISYAVVKPGVLFKKEEKTQNFFPAYYVSGKLVDLEAVRKRYDNEKMAAVERSENFDYVVSSNCKIKDFVPLVKDLLMEQNEIPDMEILFLPERSKTVIYFCFQTKDDERTAAFFTDFVQKVPHKSKSL